MHFLYETREYLEGEVWIKFDFTMNIPKNSARRIFLYYDTGHEEHYYVGGKYHRLDGPAIICRTSKNPHLNHWYIQNIWLEFLDESDFESAENLMKYVTHYPQYTKEVVILARYNNWLNEQQTELLECLDMMK